jgi:hypothetical protein
MVRADQLPTHGSHRERPFPTVILNIYLSLNIRNMRMHFNDLFIIQNDMMTAKQGLTVRIGSVTVQHNAWYAATGGVSVGGVDMAQLVGKEMEVDSEFGIRVVKHIYA